MHNQMDNFTTQSVGQSQQEVLLQKTYGLLAWSFLPTAAGAFLSMAVNLLTMLGNQWIMIGMMFAFFYGMCFLIEKNRYNQTGVVLLMVFTFGMGVLLGPLLTYSGMFANGAKLVGVAAAMTAGIFFTMSALARHGNFNTNALGRFLAMGGIVLMIAVVANLFLQMPVLSLTISGVFVVFSSLMIMWQIRNVLEGGEDSHISAALTIYISLYNLFTSLLRLLLSFAGED
ncbi:Bax inhibitor-1 family protein [Kingella kingae]|uniref:TEGT family testis enhanced gene transfer transporter n=3 Tax=Kingella kingae TaxID=504 RepID=F5S7J9_KINKI|nr:Bax inhibitor-1 family protein [Kingella kingae]EGK08981.1 TEGT family testis enhanced gene transfer transporter [Kingella kingae ATCC 23330]MDK4533908.1 Bax inhibitor-1 family protein [Kingella kingae]MDK4540299.1 Bax inhibitor-1 family protein [Kingella kingae]MDK4552940.1 Bax inhibitor-1 family protein [Kingella kingae]UOP02074.1 Bax inhibitor-1 family protein [Kingella kingae]